MTLYVGTSGFSYKEWKGSFYPEDLSNREMLPYYARRLGAVEINYTFYRLPREKTVQNWASQVPEGFRFTFKASRRITHIKRLQGSEEETAYLFDTLAPLGPCLGAVLFQLPPYLQRDSSRLEAFVSQLPEEVRVAFEFRHPSWFDETIYGILRSRNCALCLSEGDEERTPPIGTASWGYLRLRRDTYSEADLQDWVNLLQELFWEDVFVFFKHESQAAGPQLASRLFGLWNKIVD